MNIALMGTLRTKLPATVSRVHVRVRSIIMPMPVMCRRLKMLAPATNCFVTASKDTLDDYVTSKYVGLPKFSVA